MTRSIFFAAFWQNIEICEDAEKLLAPASKCAIGVKNFALLVLVENAVARQIGYAFRVELPEVIDRLVSCDFLGWNDT